MFPTRTGAGAAQETPEDLHCQDDEHQEPVEKHCGAVCQLVSVSCLWPGLHGSLSNQSQHPLCWESMNYTWARPPRWNEVKYVSVKLTRHVEGACLRCHLAVHLLIVSLCVVCAGWQVMGSTTASLAVWWTRRPSPPLCAMRIITLWLALPLQPAWRFAPRWAWWVGVEGCSPSWS